MSDPLATILDVIAEIGEVDASTLSPEMNLVADLGFDSAKAMRLLVELEERFDVEIPDEAAAEMSSIGDVRDFVATLL